MRTNYAKPRGWGGTAVIGALMVLVAVLGLVIGRGEVSALEPISGEFNPEVDVELSSDESDVNADLTTLFSIPEGDLNYSKFISFTPVEFFPSGNVPLGAEVGELHALATLGLLNGPCNTPLPPDFDLYWASTDISDTCTFEEQWEDSDGNGLYDGIDRYPDFITRIVGNITPVQRMFGYALVGGSDVTINFVIYEAGALPGFPAAWGRPSVTVLNDMGDPGGEPTPSPITSFCAPLETEITLFGLSQNNTHTDEDEAGYEVRRNPGCGGTYTFRWYAESMLDLDGDGIANYNDTCPYDPNLGDFRKPHLTGGGDGASECGIPTGESGSGDGIDCACDPDPNLPGGSPIPDLTHCWTDSPGGVLDCDGDGFDNRGDNCPLDPNPDQSDVDSDSIGDECDDNPNTPDGDSITVNIELDVDIEGPDCNVDSDGDGFLDGEEMQLGSCYDDPCEGFCSETEAADSTPEDQSIAGTCSDGVDNDKDGYVDDHDGGCADDTDGDGVSDEGEDELGSDPEDAESTPEDAGVCDVCTDGVDNDGDGLTDAEDEGCEGAGATPAPTATPAPGEGTPTPEVTATPTVAIEVEFCPPVIPGTYYGLVDIDGKPAADGYELTASIGGTQWADTIISGGRYAMDIPDHLPAQEPCFEGGTITFELNGMTCMPVEEGADEFAAGLQNVDLDCAAPATPVATPPPAATPAPTPPPATPTATPAAPPVTGSGGLANPSQGLPLWAMALAGCAGLMTVAGLGTLVAAKRR